MGMHNRGGPARLARVALLALLVLGGAAGCRDTVPDAPSEEPPGSPPPPTPTGTLPSGTSVLLQVVEDTGIPLANAAVSTRDALFPTDSAGYLLLENLTPGRFLARVEARGFASASVVLELDEGAHLGHRVKLLPRGEPHLLEASSGGVIDTPNVRVTLPAHAIVDTLGRPVSGTVEVTVTPLDPTTQLGAMPGPLEGSTSEDEQVQLESFFMAEVSLWSGGAHAQLAPGASATLEFVVPESLASRFHAGDVVPAWWFDLDAGLWRQEGEGTIRDSAAHPGTRVWEVTVQHFTWWNCDALWRDRSCVDVRTVDEAGAPLPHQAILAEGLSYTGYSRGNTGATGRGCIEIKRGETARISIGTPGETGYASAVVKGSETQTACGKDVCTPVTLVRGQFCVPGAYEECAYSGPEGTPGRGTCRAARKRCNVDGTAWSACTGEVLPVPESCRTPFDDDCDGTVNEDCGCAETEGLSCYTGPPDTRGRGRCHDGTAVCDAFGEPACVGQQLPSAESCATLGDEDCDGVEACPVPTLWAWSPPYPTSGCYTGHAEVRGLAMDGAGNTLVVGNFVGEYQFGSTSLSGGGQDIFVAKFDTSGLPLWSKRIAFGTSEPPALIAVDGDGNALVAGAFQGSLRVDDTYLPGGRGETPFVVKFSPSGDVLWAQRFESLEGDAYLDGLAVDSAGNVAVTGNFKGTLDIGSVKHTVPTADSFYVAKLSAGTGAPLWSRVHNHPAWARGMDAAMDKAGNVLLVGGFDGRDTPFAFDGTVLSSTGPDVFAMKLAAGTGSTLWVRKAGPESTNQPSSPSVNVDEAGNAWVLACARDTAVVMTKLDGNGHFLESSQLTAGLGNSEVRWWRMTFDASGNMLLVGAGMGSVHFGTEPQELTSNSGFVAWYDPHGRHLTHRLYTAGPVPPPYGGTGNVTATGVAVDASGRVVLGGYFQGTTDFGSGPWSSCEDHPFLQMFDPTP